MPQQDSNLQSQHTSGRRTAQPLESAKRMIKGYRSFVVPYVDCGNTICESETAQYNSINKIIPYGKYWKIRELRAVKKIRQASLQLQEDIRSIPVWVMLYLALLQCLQNM
jgi:hypothetical protein